MSQKQMTLPLDERKFEVRTGTLLNGDYFVWRLNAPWFNGKDRCVAGPFISLERAQSAIDEGRISCL